MLYVINISSFLTVNLVMMIKLLTLVAAGIIIITFSGVFYMYIHEKIKIGSIDEDLVVKIQQGLVRGQERRSTLNKIKYYAFKRIPYAKPPIGSLRFKDPQPADPWDGVLNNSRKVNKCIQIDISGQLVGDEDCLYLNVYTTQILEKRVDSYPVMVWIHGGGFTIGSSSEHFQGAGLLIEHGIVLVTLNYRLGVLGFLNTLNKNAPGNSGLKDQLLALKWVKNNIHNFGGDPNKVTIFGESAGSASVQYHTLSPLSRGLFHRIIMESGSVLNPWAFTEDPKDCAFQLGKILDFNGTDEIDLFKYLLNVPAEKLILTQNKMVDYEKSKQCLDFPFLPSIEMEGTGNNFLTEHPRTLLERGEFAHIPAIIGLNSKEGLLMLLMHSFTTKKTYEQFIPEQLHLVKGSKEYEELAKEIKTYFFHNNPVDVNHLDEYTDICGDIAFNIGINKTINHFLIHSDSKTYIYEFTFDGKLNGFKQLIKKLTKWTLPNGVSHADELGYIFPQNKTATLDVNSHEIRTVHRMTSMWTSFAKASSPNEKSTKEVYWEPATKHKVRHLKIGENLKLVDAIFLTERMKFWDNVFRKYSV
ncbi:juvenile hormone esterase-like [Lycorma delicatula]|uniref:juvenile hormone esterase-like n=1 Tax=Lycorma delicatula TaxID=130591 RepID=UPI003F511C02